MSSRWSLAASSLLLGALSLHAADGRLSGQLADPQGKPVAGASVRLAAARGSDVRETGSGPDGRFAFADLPAGEWKLSATAAGFAAISQTAAVAEGRESVVELQFTRLEERRQTLTVTADVTEAGVQQPDPAQRVLVREDLLDANPGRPGAPVSLPGVPVETASGGIKAPQYFAPGVAGDHGEPIAMFLQVGTFLLPNNLSANAHGNGYTDPNLMLPAIIESVATDGGAFNVREGDHSVNLAATYAFHSTVDPFATFTADSRDADLSAGWNWLALEVSYGNGFLDRLEHRRQYKLNAIRSWSRGGHTPTLLFLGYYGQSMVPGLVPIGVPNLHDTIDPRQRDQTHTGVIALNDVWHAKQAGELQLSTFFRTYNLALDSNFGDGLIRQSEFRTVTGGNATYIRRVNTRLALMAGIDSLREAPRRDDLDRYASTDPAVYGPFQKVTANNLTLNFLTPFVAAEGNLAPWLRYYLGWRRDEIGFHNEDLLAPSNSFDRWTGINSPKATLSLLPPDRLPLPSVSLSFGEAFFTNDPRIGAGSRQGSLVSQAHAWQLVAGKTVWHTDLRATLGHITQEASLAKIDPDTGLQYNEGPSRNRYATLSARRYFGAGLLQASFSKADARDLSSGAPVPEAPRTIFDVLGTLDRLPFQLQARGEFEEVGRKPLGDGFVSVPVRELRGALVRSFHDGRLLAGVHFQLARGYTGQTTEVLALPSEGEPFERVTGVFIPSYATVSVSWRFRRR